VPTLVMSGRLANDKQARFKAPGWLSIALSRVHTCRLQTASLISAVRGPCPVSQISPTLTSGDFGTLRIFETASKFIIPRFSAERSCQDERTAGSRAGRES
jgi:hypothetical protein